VAFPADSRRLLHAESGFQEIPSQSYQSQFSPQAPLPPQQQQAYSGYQYDHNAADMSTQQPRPSLVSHLWSTTKEIFRKKWPRIFFATAAVQAVLCIAFEAYTFARFLNGQRDEEELGSLLDNQQVQAQFKTIPTFLTLFIFGFIYEVVIVWDALRGKNTIQVIGVCVANLALMIYTAIQIEEIEIAIDQLRAQNAFVDTRIWADVKPLLIAIPCIIALGSILLSLIAWKLYQEFAWDILKHIGADYRMKKRFLHYQIYIALLKFDFFFFIGFTVQFLVVVTGKDQVEIGLTAAAIPITIVILLVAALCTRKEWKPGMIFIMVLYLGGLSYFIFKLARIYDFHHAVDYMAVRKSLTAFAVLTILLIILTITNGLVCMFNFGSGLKQHLVSNRAQELDKDQVSYSLNDVKQPQMPSRMTID
jgi:hypothetical protein